MAPPAENFVGQVPCNCPLGDANRVRFGARSELFVTHYGRLHTYAAGTAKAGPNAWCALLFACSKCVVSLTAPSEASGKKYQRSTLANAPSKNLSAKINQIFEWEISSGRDSPTLRAWE